MSQKIRYSVRLFISSVVLSAGFFFLFRNMYQPSVEIDCNVKTFNTFSMLMMYNKSNKAFDGGKSFEQLLGASQFFKMVPFVIPANEAEKLRLNLGKRDNIVFFDKMLLTVKGVGKRDTLKTWTGEEMLQVIDSMHNINVIGQTRRYLQVRSTDEDAFIVFNQQIPQLLKTHFQHQAGNRLMLLLAAIVMALFTSVTISFLLKHFQLPPLSVFLQKGYLLPTGFVAIIFLVFLDSQLDFIPDISNHEKRRLAAKPVLHTDNAFEYPDLYGGYVKDNFAFRNSLFFLHSLLKVKLFDESPMNDVIVGKKGWFYENEANVISDYRNLAQVPQEELAIVTLNMMQRKAWLAKRNIKFYVIVPPNKNMIYPEYMRNGIFQTENIGTNRLRLYKEHMRLHSNINLIDPSDSLRAAKQRYDVYYSTDTHWNLYGGFKGYQVLMNEVTKDFPNLKPITEDQLQITSFFSDQGDLAGMVGLHDVYRRKEYSLKLVDTSWQLRGPAVSDIKIEYRNNKTIDGSQLKLLMFRDSYANYLIPFLNLHFKDATYIWSYEFMDKLIEEQKPDVVIFESLQRFMSYAMCMQNPESMSLK